MRIYTKTGDQGKTQLLNGQRTLKSDQRLEAYGSLDELGAHVGALVAMLKGTPGFAAARIRLAESVQHDLFNAGSELATPSGHHKLIADILLQSVRSQALEADIDAMAADLPPIRTFILSGGSLASAQAHLCRTVCRRSEREVVRLNETEPVRAELLVYLNRLSDWFFMLARCILNVEKLPEVPWQKTPDGL